MSNHSITGGGFNAHLPAENPTPAPQREGTVTPSAATSPGYITRNTDLPDSAVRTTEIDAGAIRDSVARTMSLHDRRVREDNGAESWRIDAEQLDADVKAGRVSAADAERLFRHLHPEVTPDQLRGRQ